MLVLVKDKCIQFSQWKYNSIPNIMRGIYKSGNDGIKKIVGNSIYNLMKIRDDRKVFIINTNNTATVMNEKISRLVLEFISNQCTMLITRELRNSTIQ